MNILDALKYPFIDRQWFSKLLTATLLAFIPVVGWLILWGYGIRIIRNISRQRNHLPSWQRFGQDFATGLYVSIGGFIYSLPIVVFLLMTMLVGWIGGDEILLLMGCFTTLLLGGYTMISTPLLYSALAWYAHSGDFVDFFNVTDRVRDLNENLGEVLGLWFNALLITLLLMIPIGSLLVIGYLLILAPLAGLLIFIILIFPIMFMFSAFSMSMFHLIGQWGQLVIRKRT